MKLFFKIKDCSGESLVEALISMLIISFSIIMLTTCIVDSGSVVKNSKASFSKYYAGNNAVLEHSTSANATGKVEITMSDQISATKFGSITGKDAKDSINTKYYKNAKTTKASVISYEKN